jgi:undecaprenyl-diphosphatase
VNLKSLLDFDAKLSGKLRVAEKPGSRRTLALILAHSGDSWFWALGLIILYMVPSPFAKQWALTQLAWIIVLALVVIVIKFLVRRQRPEGEWGAIYRNTDPHSFPSGHSARAFLIATIAVGLGPVWAAVVLLVWAPLVALSRVAMGVHYLSDVVVGSLVGILVGTIGLQFNTALFAYISGFVGNLW